jgi:hypothetical protein
MNEKTDNIHSDELWANIDQPQLELLSPEDRYRWGITVLQYMMKVLQAVESKALAKQDLSLFNSVRGSMMMTLEVETKLKRSFIK